MYICGVIRISGGFPEEFFCLRLVDARHRRLTSPPLPKSACTFHLGISLVVSQLWNQKGKGGEVWFGRLGYRLTEITIPEMTNY